MKEDTITFVNLIIVACLSVCFADQKATPCDWEGIKGVCVNRKVCLTALDTRSPAQPECAESPGAPKLEEPLICCTDCDLVNDTSKFVISALGNTYWKDGRKSRDQCLQYLTDLPHKCHQDGYYGGIRRHLDEEKQCHMYYIWGIGGAPPPGSEPPRENPYEALIGYGEGLESAVWMTAGAIISDKFILTSARGYQTTEGNFPLKFAAVGVKNRKSDKQNWTTHKVKKIHQHPEYSSDKTRYNDIALLELETPIKFTDDVLPACLPDPGEEYEVSTAKYSSWKEPTSKPEEFTDTATIVQVNEVKAKDCDSKISEAENKPLTKSVDAATELCYGDSHTCLNVIGSPVVVTTYMSRCMNTVVGVNAYGDRCGTAVFTKVSQYVPWIESVVWP